MEDKPHKKKSKRVWAALGLGALAFLGIGSLGASEPSALTNTQTYEAAEVAPLEIELDDVRAAEASTEKEVQRDDGPSSGDLSNDNYYTNVDGNRVHSPAYSDTSCEAVGASAECRDGTCSFSQNRRGTCSHHGGVARWIY